MYLFRIFYSFLPLRNPIGFGASDLIVLAIAILMAAFFVAKAWLSPYLHSLAPRSRWSMAALAGIAVLLRLALLPRSPAPVPSGADDFSYLLLGDTLAHFRLANSTHPLHRFFEAVFVLQQPAYSSIYPLGQGFVLAAGQFLGSPWIGVLLAGGVFCAACYWMLRGWTTPHWALAGGALAILEFGPLNPWMNSYWGGYVSAIAGCLVFGSLPRLRESDRVVTGLVLGLGVGLQMLSRPFEAVFLCAAILIYFLIALRRRVRALIKPVTFAVAPMLVAFAFVLMQNKAVTDSWTTMPYMLSRYEYGVPASLTFQPNPVPHVPLTQEQELDYRAQSAIHGNGGESVPSYVDRLTYRLRYLRFFLLPPLFLALAACLLSLRQWNVFWAIGTVALFLLGTNFYPYFYAHYVAAITCLFVLLSVRGLARLNGSGHSLQLGLCCASFVFWFGIYASGRTELLPLTEYQSWNYIDQGDPQGRMAIESQLLTSPERQLVFVRYAPYHRFEEWIHNDADLDGSRIVWANDLGPQENQNLIRYFPDRKIWLLKPDAHPPALTPY